MSIQTKIMGIVAITSLLVLNGCAQIEENPFLLEEANTALMISVPQIDELKMFPSIGEHPVSVTPAPKDIRQPIAIKNPSNEKKIEPVSATTTNSIVPSPLVTKLSSNSKTAVSGPAKVKGPAPAPIKITTENTKAKKYSGATVGGFFIYTSSNSTTMQNMLQDIKATGADTVITFGSHLRPVKVKNNVPTAEGFTTCKINSKGCLTSLSSNITIKKYFTYDDKGSWNAKAFECSQSKTILANNGEKFTLMVIPTRGSCTKNVDVAISKDSKEAKDANSLMIDIATGLKMKTFVGMPAPIQDSKEGWLPDTSYNDTLQGFTKAFLTNYKLQHGQKASLAGFYHHTEMPLSPSHSWDKVRNLYSLQNKLIKQVLPKKSALISPYLDARLSYSARTKLTDVAQSTKKLLDTAHGVHLILAPQDGQGTGKVGAFIKSEANHAIDKPSIPVAGKGTYGQRYEAGTGDFMKEVVKGAKGRKNVSIWVNLELMTATTSGAPVCEDNSLGRGKASLNRVIRQSKIGTPTGVSKTIGFMWQPYATCGSDPLGKALALNHTK